MSIDINKIRHGDTVILCPLKVVTTVQAGVRVANGYETNVFFPTRLISEHNPQALRVGDVVVVIDRTPHGEVMAIDKDDYVIVKFSDGKRVIYHISDLYYRGQSQ